MVFWPCLHFSKLELLVLNRLFDMCLFAEHRYSHGFGITGMLIFSKYEYFSSSVILPEEREDRLARSMKMVSYCH